MLEDKGKKGRRQWTYDVCVGGETGKGKGTSAGENSFSIIRYLLGTQSGHCVRGAPVGGGRDLRRLAQAAERLIVNPTSGLPCTRPIQCHRRLPSIANGGFGRSSPAGETCGPRSFEVGGTVRTKCRNLKSCWAARPGAYHLFMMYSACTVRLLCDLDQTWSSGPGSRPPALAESASGSVVVAATGPRGQVRSMAGGI